MCDKYGCAFLSKKQKSLQDGLNKDLPLQARVEKTVHGVETH